MGGRAGGHGFGWSVAARATRAPENLKNVGGCGIGWMSEWVGGKVGMAFPD